MHDLALLTVIADDVDPAALLDSLERFNTEHLPVVVAGIGAAPLVEPRPGVELVTSRARSVAEALLGFGAEGTARHWVCVDPRTQFLRPFGSEEFLRDMDTSYVFATEDRPADAGTDEVQRTLGTSLHPCRRSGPGLVMSASIVDRWRSECLGPRGWSIDDAVTTVPSAGDWYLGWALNHLEDPALVREPAIVSMAACAVSYDYLGMTLEDLSRGYLAVVHDRTSDPVGPGGGSLRQALGRRGLTSVLAAKGGLAIERRVRGAAR